MHFRLRSSTERRAAFALSLVLVAVGVSGVVDRSTGLALADHTSQDTFADVSFSNARDAWSLIERPCTGRPSCEVVEVTSAGPAAGTALVPCPPVTQRSAVAVR